MTFGTFLLFALLVAASFFFSSGIGYLTGARNTASPTGMGASCTVVVCGILTGAAWYFLSGLGFGAAAGKALSAAGLLGAILGFVMGKRTDD